MCIRDSNCTVLFINQLREKVGVMFGSPETTTGGRALKFYASVRMDIRRIESLKQGGEVVGNRVRVKVVKNKIAPPFKEAEFDIMFGRGISVEGDVLDLAVKEDIVEKSGAWFAYGGAKIGQGRENAKIYLQDNPAVCEEIENKVRARYGLGEDGAAPEGASADADVYKRQGLFFPPSAIWRSTVRRSSLKYSEEKSPLKGRGSCSSRIMERKRS